ncbi:MAG: gliding motility lipoprotein GldD [Bacteroidales bacterium]
MKRRIRFGLVMAATILFLVGCRDSYTPKPRGYFRIALPVKEYRVLEGNYPYSFEIPAYSRVVRYAGTFTDSDTSGYWLNLEFPQFDSRIYLTYKEIRGNLAQLLDDAHSFAYKHSVLADAIGQIVYIDTLARVYGVLFDIKGNTASSIQFYATDSTRNFLRGALYFDATPNQDSLSPVIGFLREDIERLMESIRWK